MDGNTILDFNAAASGLVLGYNSNHLANIKMTDLYDRFITHKVNLNTLPPHDAADIIRTQVMQAAPQNMKQVHLGGGQSREEANELAISVALKQYMKKNGVEDRKQVTVLGFNNANHG